MSGKREGSTRLRDIRRESLAEPPSRAAIDALPPLGDRDFALDMSGLSIRVDGIDADLNAAAGRRFAAYRIEPEAAFDPLRTAAHRDVAEYYVQPERERSEGYYRLRIVHEAGCLRLVTYAMAAWIDPEAGRAGVAFGTGGFDPRERAFENFLRVATAWRAVVRGGFLIHGASIVRGGRAYVFFGKSASGKSTLAAMNTEGRVVSDDLTLVLPGPGGLHVAGSPFRGTFGGGEPVVGLYPLVAMFRLVQDARTFVETPKRLAGFAEFVANLPFVNDALAARPDLFASLEAAAASVPLRLLHFEKRPGFWGAVDAALDPR